MSEIRENIADVIQERDGYFGDDVINLRTGRSFRAEVEEVQAIELNVELGRDARESVIIHVANRYEAGFVRNQDRLQVTLSGVLTTLQVLRRDDNPISSQVDFGCMKVTEKDT